MKILCPEHGGLIELPSKDIADAFNTPSKSLVFSCPVCQEEVLIRNIKLQEEDMHPLLKGNSKTPERKRSTSSL